MNKANFKEWFDRYKYAELIAICTALATSQLSWFFNNLTVAYLITFGEYVAFYSVILFMNYKKLVETNRALSKSTSWKENVLLTKDLILEFGYPAFLDFFFIRPFCMYWLPILTGNYFLGIILGKITADTFFYTFTIVNYEWIKKKK